MGATVREWIDFHRTVAEGGAAMSTVAYLAVIYSGTRCVITHP